jgi:hypothetical protein
VQDALEALLIPLPGRSVNAMESWKFSRAIGVETPFGMQRATLDMTCTYLGVRNQKGRDEAVITIAGLIRESDMAGRANGLIIVDVGNGLVREVELKAEIDLPPLEAEIEGKREKIRFLAIESLQLKRL